MSSYFGFSIFVAWVVLFSFLSIISESYTPLIIGVIFSTFIIILAALLDARIDQLNKNGGINND